MENTLKWGESHNWWVSAPGSCPGGRGAEWVAYELSATGVVRVEYVSLIIPPLPQGPLSVRIFHLEKATQASGPWERCSPDFHTFDVEGAQEWGLFPPVEARFVRIICKVNAARALVEERMHALLPSAADCIGFYSIRFS